MILRNLQPKAAWLVVGLLMLMLGQAQALTPTAEPTSPSIIFAEVDASFDEELVRQAIPPLEARGLRVVVILVQTGEEADFLSRLREFDAAQGSQLDEDVVALYVSIDTRYSEVRWNTRRYDEVIPAIDLRRTAMNPLLRDGLYDKAFENALRVLEEALKNYDLGTPIATLAPTPVSSPPAPSGSTSEGLGSVIGPFAFLGIVGFIIYISNKLPNSGSSSYSSDDSSSYSSDDSSSYSSSDGGSSGSSSGGGSDGGSWND